MKKKILLFASAALLFTGCAKEPSIVTPDSGETVNVSVSTVLQSSGLTRASWDNDGNGAEVDHWIMEVYDVDGALYDRQELTDQSGLTNTFDVTLIKNQSYKFAFWADTKGSYDTDDLREVKTVSTVAGLDSRDAFFAEVDYTSNKSETLTAKLYRPFAQINVVALDLDKIYQQMVKANTTADYDKFIPNTLKLACDTYNEFNVLTGEVSDVQPAELTLASCYADYTAHAAKTTIFMDYGFAAAEKEVKDMDFSFISNGVEIAYNFTNIPVQRNYRTNISGNLLSNDATWNVEIIPIWEQPEYDIPHYIASSIADAQEYITTNDSNKSKDIDLNDAKINQSDVNGDGTIHFTLNENSPEDIVNFNLPAIPSDITGCTGWTISYEGDYPTKNVGVNAPANTIITINTPNSHVTLSGTTYAEIIASTGVNSLIIPKGVTVQKLTVNKGGLEMHGAVNKLIIPEDADVIIRACENLNKSVYEVAKPFIDMRYTGEKNQDGSWNIVIDKTLLVIEESSSTVIVPEGITHLSLSDELAAARKAAETWMDDEDAHNPFFLDYTIESVSLPSSMNTISGGLFYNSMALKEITIDGKGNLSFGNCPIVNSYNIEKITIKNLPETCVFKGVNDNSKLNQNLINLDTPKTKKIDIFLPAGWIAKGFQYKFNPCCSVPCYTYEDGKLIGYCKSGKWYTVNEVHENGVASVIASEDGKDKTAIIETSATTIIPEGTTTLQASDEMVNDPKRTYDQDWPFTQNTTVKSVSFPATLLVNKDGKQDFNGTFQHCDALNDITIEGGNDMLITFPLIAWCKEFKSLKIEKLPTSFQFKYGCNDNSGVNNRLVYADGAGMPGATIKVYLPNGWKAAGYQYKFGSQMDSGIPTIEVYEADAEGNYQYLGKSVSNSWVDAN